MNILTISRLVGSYGDEIAALVADKMGLELIGRNGLHELAQSCDTEYKDACELYESEHGPGFFERFFFDRPSYKSLFEALAYEQASRGNVVIIGRGPQIVLRNVPGVFNVRIVAPLEARIERTKKRHNCWDEEAGEYIQRYDQERETLIRTIFGKHQEDWPVYDMILNTLKFPVEDAADIIVHSMGKLAEPVDEAAAREKLKNLALGKRIETLLCRKLSSAVARNVEIVAESGGVITIAGRIGEKRDKEKVEKLVSGYPGVTKVENQLKYTELSY